MVMKETAITTIPIFFQFTPYGSSFSIVDLTAKENCLFRSHACTTYVLIIIIVMPVIADWCLATFCTNDIVMLETFNFNVWYILVFATKS